MQESMNKARRRSREKQPDLLNDDSDFVENLLKQVAACVAVCALAYVLAWTVSSSQSLMLFKLSFYLTIVFRTCFSADINKLFQ